MRPDLARRLQTVVVGSPSKICRLRGNAMTDLLLAPFRDLRLALKSLRRSAGFSFVAVVTMALGIGANTAMFSLLNGYIFQPVPYAGEERIDRLYRATPTERSGGVSPADWLDLREAAPAYGEIAAYAVADMSLSEPGRPAEPMEGMRTTVNLFDLLGTRPRLGRGFRPEEETHGNHRVLVLSDRYWHKRFGGDPAVVGKRVRVDGEPHEIIGVLPPKFSDWRHLEWVDAFRPLGLAPEEAANREVTTLRLIGRRGDGVSPAQASAFVEELGRRAQKEHPAVHAGTTWRRVAIADSFLPGNGQVMISMLVCLSALVLLIGCSNLANLLLARTIARAREFALRAALGASRFQVLRPLVVETLLLAFAGGAGALVVARWTYDWIAVASAGDNGVGVELGIDWHVLAWAFGACLLAALAFGVAPAVFVRRLDLNSTLKSATRGSTADRRQQRFRNLLIVGQFALAMVLLAGAALFVRGLHELNNRREGWESAHLVTGSVVLPQTTYESLDEVVGFQRQAVQRLSEIPGVEAAAVTHSLPFFGSGETSRLAVEGQPPAEPGREPAAQVNGVGPGYFTTLGTRLLAGRAFTDRDTLASPRVFVVNESMARALFGSSDPLGRRVARIGTGAPQWGEIVGVVADVESVSANPSEVDFQLYEAAAQTPRRTFEIAVRTAGVPPGTVVESVRDAMMALDADLPVRKLQPADATILRANYQLGVLRTLLSALATLGLGLAILGTYGVIARSTAQRRGEFGIRLALGATARDILSLVLASGARLALLGSAIGLLGAIGISRLFAAAFPGIQAQSVGVLAGVTLLLLAIAQLACYLPARSAARLSPSQTLRSE
jgi:putative ABC transport system permease protein